MHSNCYSFVLVKAVCISCPFNLSSRLIYLQAYFFCVYYIVVNLIPWGARIISFTRTREVVLDVFFSTWVCTKLVGLHNQGCYWTDYSNAIYLLNKTKNVHVKDNLIALHLIGSLFLNNNIQRQDVD